MNLETITANSLLLLFLFPLTAAEKTGKNIHLGTDIYTKYSFHNSSSLQFGMYENDLLLEDEMNSVESPYSEDSFLRSRLETMGWYSNAGLGLSYLTPLGEESHWSVPGSAYYTSVMSTAQFILKMNYSFQNPNIGFTSSYMPVPQPQSAESNYYFFNYLHRKS